MVNIGHIIGSVGNKFKDLGKILGKTAEKVITKVGGGISTIAGKVHDDVKGVAGGVKSSFDNVVNKVADIDKNLVNQGAGVINNGINKGGDVLKSFSWPLVIVAGVLGFAVLKK
jgi:phage-related protein